MITALLQNAASLLLLLMLCFIFSGAGLLLLQGIRARFSSSGEQLFYAFGLGAAVTGYAVFLLAATQLLVPAPLYSLLALLLALAAVGWWRSGPALKPPLLEKPQGVVEQVAAALLLLVLAAALLLALTPETARDALLYHLAVPKLFLKQGGFYFVPGNPFAHYPFHTELLFLLALFLQGDILAKLVNFAFLPVILLGMGQFAVHRQQGNAFPYLSMLILAMLPSVFVDAHMAYNDFAVTLFTMGALFAFLNWLERKERGWLLLSGLFTGMALACKYTTLLLPMIGGLGILIAHRNGEKARPLLQDLATYVLAVLLCGAPFYLKNWLVTGNPFYPFLYGIFGGKGWDPEQARLYDGLVMFMGMGRQPLDYLLLPWNLSVHARLDSTLFDGVIGPLFLLVLPFLAGVRKKDIPLKIILAYCALLFMFWASASQQIRYLFPVFPLLALLVGTVLTRYRENRSLSLLLGVAVAGSLLFNSSQIVRDFLRVRPLPFVLGGESRDAFLGRSLSPYRMYRFVSTTLPLDAKVYLVYMKNWTFLCERECYADAMFEHYTLQKILASSATPEDVRRNLQVRGFSHLMYDVNHVTGAKSMLTPEEQELFRAFQANYLTLLKNDGPYYLYRL